MSKKRKLAVFGVLLMFSGIVAAQQGQYTNLSVEKHYAEPEPLQAGEYADIWLRVINTGSAEAESPVIELEDNFPFQVTGKDRWEIKGGLKTGERYSIKTQVKVSENAVFGENSLEVLKSADGGETMISDELGFDVRTDDRSLIVEDLEFPQRVEPGSSSTMVLKLENQAESIFRNVDVSLDTSEIPVATRETSRKRISSINAEGSENVSFTLDVDPNADNELHDLPITISYEDQAGNQHEVTETTGINIGGYPELDVAVEESDIRSAGKGTMTLRIINKGEGEAKFTEIRVNETENVEILSEDSIYLGSMIADDFQTAEFELYVQGNETLELPVSLSFTSGEGDQEKSFTVERELYSQSELERYGFTQSGGTGVAVGLILLVLVAGTIYYRRRKRD